MTSRSLFFKLLKENSKRNLWIMALSFLVFFFSLPVATAFIMSDIDESFYNTVEKIEAVKLERAMAFVGLQNGIIAFVISVAALVCGVAVFSYLHNKKQIDFYHSLPVKRGSLFIVNYISGFLALTISYGINLIITLVIIQMNGVSMGQIFGTAITVFFFHLTYFLLIYSTVVVAMVMTGNKVIGILGSVVFFAYGPAVLILCDSLYIIFLDSYFEGIPVKLATYLSPIGHYINQYSEWYTYQGSRQATPAFFTTLIAAMAIGALGFFLNQKRPSEAAGKAMAFPMSCTPIKCLLVVPIAIYGGLFFYSMRDSDGWGLFGLLCTLIISYAVIEIIYHFDFRKLFSHKLHLAGCIISSIAIVCTFRFDLLQYDSYLPKASDVTSVSVYMENVEGWVDYNSVITLKDGTLKWGNQYGRDYVKDHMILSDSENTLLLAESGISRIQQMKKFRAEKGEQPESISSYSRVYIWYHLKSGGVASRVYSIDLDQMREPVSQIIGNKEYKDGVYPLLLQNGEETEAVYYKENEAIVKKVELSDLEKTELLSIYQKEFGTLTRAQMEKEMPIASLQFRTKMHQGFLNQASGRNRWSGNESYFYYPLYPSFTESIAFLKEKGIEAGKLLTADQISVMTLSTEKRYREKVYVDSDQTYLDDTVVQDYRKDIVDKKIMEEMLPFMIYQQNSNSFYEKDIEWTVSFVINKNGEEWNLDYGISRDHIPAVLEPEIKEWEASLKKDVQEE